MLDQLTANLSAAALILNIEFIWLFQPSSAEKEEISQSLSKEMFFLLIFEMFNLLQFSLEVVTKT